MDISEDAAIMHGRGVSTALINRIITACLFERTSIQWFGQRTATRIKTRGIKQRCPLSPLLFIPILHHVLVTLQEFWPDLRLAHSHSIKLPCILGYADDLLFLCNAESDVEMLLDLLTPLLASVGLEINTAKTQVLFHIPTLINNIAPDTLQQFGKYHLTVVTTLRYLGVYITSSLTRTMTTSERIKKADSKSNSVNTKR